MQLVHEEGFDLGFITCQVADGERAAIDTVVGVGASSADPAPSRPSVVQTDAVKDQEEAGVQTALVAGGVLLALTGAAGTRHLRSRRWPESVL